MTELKKIKVSEYFYTPYANEDFVCCGELQNRLYCYESDVAQGCVFCEIDPYSPCECESCE